MTDPTGTHPSHPEDAAGPADPPDERLRLVVTAEMGQFRGRTAIRVALPEEVHEIEGHAGYWFIGPEAEVELARLLDELRADHAEHATFALRRTVRRPGRGRGAPRGG